MFETTNQQPSISDFPNFEKKKQGPMVQLLGLSPFLMVFTNLSTFLAKIHEIPAIFTVFFSIFTVFPRFFPGFPRFSLALPGPPWVPLKVHRSPRQAEEPLQDAVQKTLGPGPWDAQNHLTSDEAYADGAVDGRNPINHQFKAINHLFMYIRIFINQWFI